MNLSFRIAPEIFARFPGYLRGVVVAHGIHNGSSPEALLAELRRAEAGLSQRLSLEDVTSHPYLAPWREAYRSLGVKPSEFRPSMEAMARRVLRQDPLPAISTVVDLGNLVSIRHLVPVGAHAIDLLGGDIALRFARGDEVFEAFGSDTVEHPQAGEIVFVEGQTVLTRRWTWRQAKHSLVTLESTAVEINVDGLPPVGLALVEQVCQELAGLVEQYCGGKVRYEVLRAENPSMEL